jgi:hypothetical protein
MESRENIETKKCGSPLVLRSGYEWRGCPQAVSRESHRNTRNKNKQTNTDARCDSFRRSAYELYERIDPKSSPSKVKTGGSFVLINSSAG